MAEYTKGRLLPARVDKIMGEFVFVLIDDDPQQIPAIMYPNRLHHNNTQEGTS